MSSADVTAVGSGVVVDWIQSDALSGTDPDAPLVAQVNASPSGDEAGAWVPFAEQPPSGDGRRVARTSLAGLPDGRHLVRVVSRDRAGNVGVHPVGAVVSDGSAPSVTDVRVVRAPAGGGTIAELAFRVDDGDGTGVSGAVAAGPAGRTDIDWTAPGAPSAGRVLVALPGPGLHLVTVRATDRRGNRGESPPVAVRVPTAAEVADARGGGAASVRWPGRPAPPHARRLLAEARRFHGRRGLRLSVRLGVARTAAEWRRVLGAGAARYEGFATMRGQIVLGPAATRGLRVLDTARRRAAARPSRADLDRAAMGLAVLLHETLHATGPAARADVGGTRSGRAFEEGVTEAATADLLRSFVAGLGVPRPLRARLLAAVGRRRPAYGPEVAWARTMSARATGSAAGSRRARAWRIAVADTWGDDRWERLAAATGDDVATLRAAAAGAADPARRARPEGREVRRE